MMRVMSLSSTCLSVAHEDKGIHAIYVVRCIYSNVKLALSMQFVIFYVNAGSYDVINTFFGITSCTVCASD
jgi:hypothetical protein